MTETNETRFAELERRVRENEEKNKESHKTFHEHNLSHMKFRAQFEERCGARHADLSEIQKDNVAFKLFIATTEANYLHLKSSIDEMLMDVKALTNKPSKRWESLTGTIITVAVTALLSFVAAHFLNI